MFKNNGVSGVRRHQRLKAAAVRRGLQIRASLVSKAIQNVVQPLWG